MKHNSLLIILTIFTLNILYSQSNSLNQIIDKNSKTFTINNNNFIGEGWDLIVNEMKQSDNVLIGEEHLTNEIPFFINKIAQLQRFDNFYIEVDPYSTQIIEKSITKLSDKERKEFNAKYKDLFSFYALEPEYKLLEGIVKSGTKLLGADQIIMYADRLLLQKLVKETKNEQAKTLYNEIIEKSESHLNEFFKNPDNPMYLFTPEFSEKINALKLLDLSKEEQTILADMLTSVEIYQGGQKGHKQRIQLMKHYLMKDYDIWKNKRNLFKYGAGHMPKGESLLTIYDMGNLISNLSESNYKKALHILIIGQSGMLGQPFRVFPPQPLDVTKWPYKNLNPFLNSEGNDWKVYDLNTIKSQLKKSRIKVDDVTLNRVIKGYDILVVIPEVTAAKF